METPKTYLIVHADDAGLSHSQNLGTQLALEAGIVKSFSLMVPCPWFFPMHQYALQNPQFDYGVHLTLTCEWKNYKFGPVAPLSKVSSLVDENGHFYASRSLLAEHANPKEVAIELKAQIDRCLQLGLTPSHLDSHMYSVGANEKFLSIYRDLGKEYAIPALLSEDLFKLVGLSPSMDIPDAELYFNRVLVASMNDFKENGLGEFYKKAIAKLKPGLNLLLVHPAVKTKEMEAITINHPNFGLDWRQYDLDFCTEEKTLTFLRQNNIILTDWRFVNANKSKI